MKYTGYCVVFSMVMMEHSAKLGTSGESRVVMVWFMVFNATFNNSSVISWMMEKTLSKNRVL